MLLSRSSLWGQRGMWMSRVAFVLRVSIHELSLRHGPGPETSCGRHFDKYFMKNVTAFVTMLQAF